MRFSLLIFQFLSIFTLVSASRPTDEDICYNENCSLRVTSPLELCRRQFTKSDIVSILDATVGRGWDNLQNLPLENVFSKEYKVCQTTPDGMFLLEDGLHLMQVKHLEIDRMAKLYETWEDYPKESINMASDWEIESAEIAGSYDKFRLEMKEKFSSSNASMLSTHLTYHAYSLTSSSTKTLSLQFLAHLRQIHEAYVSGGSSLAQYHADMLVQRFGTHVITSAHLGARFEQNDYVDLSGNPTDGINMDELKAAAASSFVETLFGLNSTVLSKKNVTEKTKEFFSKVLKYSEMRTYGGPDVGQLFESVYDGLQLQVGYRERCDPHE